MVAAIFLLPVQNRSSDSTTQLLYVYNVYMYVCVLVSLRRSVLFPLISLLILLVGEVIAIFSHYDRRKKVLTFVSGILFVIAGTIRSARHLSVHHYFSRCTYGLRAGQPRRSHRTHRQNMATSY